MRISAEFAVVALCATALTGCVEEVKRIEVESETAPSTADPLQAAPDKSRVVLLSELDDADHGDLVNIYISENNYNFCEINLPVSEIRSGLTVKTTKGSSSQMKYLNASCHWDGGYFFRHAKLTT